MRTAEKIEYIKENLDTKVSNATWSYIAIQELLAEVERLKLNNELADDGIELLKEEKASLIMHLEKIVEDYRTRPYTRHRDAYILAKDALESVGVEVG